MPVCRVLWPAAMLSYHATAAGKEGEGEGGRGRDILPLACNHIAYTEKEGEGGGILPVCPFLWPAAMLSYHATAAGKEGEGEGGRGRDILTPACNHIAYIQKKEGEGGGILPVCRVLWPAAMLSYHATTTGKEGEGDGGEEIYLYI